MRPSLPLRSTSNGMEFRPGSKFYCFAEFEDAFERWKLENFHPFRVASSETLRMPDGSTNDVFKYRYIVYHCAHYGAPRMRGAGKRPNQNYLPCGCRAMLRLNFSWSENVLRITTLNCQHTGHEISAEAFSRFSSKMRRVSPSPPTPAIAWVNLPTLPSINNNNNVHEVEEDKMQLGQKENGLQIQELSRSAPADVMDLSQDKRSDEERFQQMHAILQGVTDHLMWCRGQEFDGKLRQLNVILKSWDHTR